MRVNRDNHKLMCVIYDTYFQWNENAGRMFRSYIPRNTPVYMPLVEWRDSGVPVGQVNRFNHFVADICRANFSPWCAICRCPIQPDCQGCVVIFPSKRVCPICKTDAFISDFRLWAQYSIGMHQLMPCAAASAGAAACGNDDGAAACCNAAACGNDDEDEDDVDHKKRPKAPKKQRPPPKMKKPSRRHRATAPSGAAPSGRTILQYIVEDCPEVHYFTQSGTRHQRVAFTSDPMDLTGPKMIQKLNMIFFLKRDIARVFDLKKAAEHKKQRDDAAAVIGGAVLRMTQVRDIKWALPWYFLCFLAASCCLCCLCFLCFRLLHLLPLLPLAASASSASACCLRFICFRLLPLLHLLPLAASLLPLAASASACCISLQLAGAQ